MRCAVFSCIGLERDLSREIFLVEFDRFKNDAGSNAFVMPPQKWVKETDAIKENLIPSET